MQKTHIRLLIFFIGCLGFYGAARLIPIHVGWLEQGLSCLSYPVLKIRQSFTESIDNMGQFFSSRTQANVLCRDYQERYEKLLAENIEIKSTLETWKDMQEVVLFKKHYAGKRDMLAAQVLTKNFLPREHFFLVDAGSDKGIVADMVAVYKNCLVGRVGEVYPHYSRVTLVTDPSCKVAAFCVGSGDQGIHEGCCKFDQTLLTYVFDKNLDLDKRLKKDDLVLSTGEGLIFPRGFGLGRVVTHKQRELQYDIVLAPLLDFTKINYCCLIGKEADYIGTHDICDKAIIKNGNNLITENKESVTDMPIGSRPTQKSADTKQAVTSAAQPVVLVVSKPSEIDAKKPATQTQEPSRDISSKPNAPELTDKSIQEAGQSIGQSPETKNIPETTTVQESTPQPTPSLKTQEIKDEPEVSAQATPPTPEISQQQETKSEPLPTNPAQEISPEPVENPAG